MSKLFNKRFNSSFFIAFFLLLIGIPSATILADSNSKIDKVAISYFNKVFYLFENSLTYDELLSNENCFSSEISLIEMINRAVRNKEDAAFMCEIHTQLTQTSCIDNGDGSYTANFDLAVDWSTAPISEDILVTVGGANIATIDPSVSSSPQTVAFSLDADGNGQDTIIAFFETTTTCADTFAIKAPAPCPPATGGCTQTGNISLGLPTNGAEAPDGSMSTNLFPIVLNTNSTAIGLNYDNVNIPSGATITSASLQFQAASNSTADPLTITINGDAADDAAVFSTSASDITNRTTTTASINWSPITWATGDIGPAQETPDLTAIIQEIIDRPGWNANQNMAFILSLSGIGTRLAEQQTILNVEFTFLGDCGAADACLAVSSSEIAGTAWNDYDYDGILNETNLSGFQGVEVQLYDCLGNLTATTVTDASGNYRFTGLSPQKYRVEFILSEELACWAKPTHAGANSGTMIQFVEPGSCVSLGLANPTDFCEANPLIGLTCFSEGTYNGVTSGDPAIIALPYDAEGHDFNGREKDENNYEGDILDDIGGLGSAYGLAWQATRQSMYIGAYHKRYSGFGANGPDAIYQYDLAGNQTGVIELDALLGGTNTAGADVHDFVTLNNGEVMDLGTFNASFDGVGKLSFGDLEMSGDMTTLYVVNLFDRKIYAIDVTDGVATNASIANSWDVPDPSGTGIHRPFALKWHQGKLWVGMVTEDAANAYVYSLDVLNGNFNLELTVPLNYDRQSVIGPNANTPDVDGSWNAWASDPDATLYLDFEDLDIAYPQAMLTDIEFDGTDMILGFRDRFGDQAGSDAYFNNTDAGNDEFTWPSTAGDILRACNNGFSYVLETGISGACATPSGIDNSGPNGVEHYHWDYYNVNEEWNPLDVNVGFHWEITQGALLQLANSPFVVTTAMDPYSDYSGGILRLNNETGRREGILANDNSNVNDLIGGYTIYESGDFGDGTNEFAPPPNTNGTFGKANGLGDLEAFCNPAPIEIGNYVWCDSIENGIQDACERGLDDIIVQLYNKDGDLVGQDTTVNGQYYFNQFNVDTTGITVITGVASPNNGWSGLDYNTQYFIVFGDGGQFVTDEFSVGGETYGITLIVNAGSNDNIDSDVDGTSLTSGSLGARPDGLPFIDLTTSSTGCGDHKYDLGIRCIFYDWGDLPDVSATTGDSDYQTTSANNGPVHIIIDGLSLGSTVDGEVDGQPTTDALGDGVDEDGLTIYPSLDITPGGTFRLPLSYINTTGSPAEIEAWLDWNNNGEFDAGEMIFDATDPSVNFIEVTAPSDAVIGEHLGLRIRISNQDDMTPYGLISEGEVEDYLLDLDCPQIICIPATIDLRRK